ncbi:MAG: YcgN family cysteine cluster protein [Pseudomonadota bacterium]
MSDLRDGFWTRPLAELTEAEWEALCDGCGKCCLIKLEDEESGALTYTDVACRLFDDATCTCGNYPLRRQLVPQCVVLTAQTLASDAAWMPASCAYRLRAEGRPLPDWHPLLAGPDRIHALGHSMRDRTTPEWEVAEEDLEDHAIGDLS